MYIFARVRKHNERIKEKQQKEMKLQKDYENLMGDAKPSSSHYTPYNYSNIARPYSGGGMTPK